MIISSLNLFRIVTFQVDYEVITTSKRHSFFSHLFFYGEMYITARASQTECTPAQPC